MLLVSPGELDHLVHRTSVDGVVPDALRGAAVWWNGPGLTALGGRIAHPFDGHGYIRRFAFDDDGSVSLRARFVRTPAYAAERAAGRLLWRGVGTLPFSPDEPDGPARNLAATQRKNVANTTLTPWGGRLLAGWEGGEPWAVDPRSLATLGPERFGGAVGHDDAFLAHTRVDVERGTLVGLSPTTGMKTGLRFLEIAGDGRVLATTTTSIDGACFVHDFVVTDRYYVVARNALDIDLGAFVDVQRGRATMLDMIRPRPSASAALMLVPRPARGASGTFAVEPSQVTLPAPAFVIHFANACDDGDAVVVDACAFPDLPFGHEFGYLGPETPPDPALPDQRAPQRLFRFVADVRSRSATAHQLAPHGIDFPRVHPALDGRRAPLIVGATRRDVALSDPFDAVVVVDLDDLERPPAVWSPGDDAVVGEPLFVPRPGGSVREGHIVVCVSRPAEERTHLVILDAANVGAGPCATVRMPLLPLGLHGTSSMA